MKGSVNVKTSKTETNRGRRRETEWVYLQGRGGGTPKSAKSGSEKRAEEGWGHSFLIHDYKNRILTGAKTTRYNNVMRKFLKTVYILKIFCHPWIHHYSLLCSFREEAGDMFIFILTTLVGPHVKILKPMSWVWNSLLKLPLMHDWTVWRYLWITCFQKFSYPKKIPLISQISAEKTILNSKDTQKYL